MLIEQGGESVVFTHRRLGRSAQGDACHSKNGNLFYLANKENREISVKFRLQDHPAKVTVLRFTA